VTQATTNTAATRPPQPANGDWTVEDSTNLYGINRWGSCYYRAGENGNMHVRPLGENGPSLDLSEIVQGLRDRGLWAPVLLRFNEIMDHRMASLRESFDRAIKDEGYHGSYEGVYPIKVNQQRSVCEQIRDAAAKYGFGLEAGSKPELLAVLALTAQTPQVPIVCNGFKDEEYIETVVLASRLRDRIYPIVERPGDLDLIIRIAREHDVTPRIGVRIKPSAKGMGRWQGSAGEAAKFGLTAAQLVEAVDKLREAGMLDCLQVVHFHIGSQVCDIISFKAAITELAWTYAELRRMGAGVTHINVGGGYGIDYEFPDKNPIPDFKSFFEVFDTNLELRRGQQVHFELGRSIVGQCGSLISTVLFTKEGVTTNFAVIDAGMTELIRPALYQANHRVDVFTSNKPVQTYDVVGPICETSDTFQKGIQLPEIQRGDLVAIRSAGAYGEVMSSGFNLRERVMAVYSE